MYHKDLLPLDYPWLVEHRSILLSKHGEYPIHMKHGTSLADLDIDFGDGAVFPMDAYLKATKKPTLAERIPVVAIGSNASSLVTKSKIQKFARPGTDETVPMLYATIENMGVGFSGHFVRSGYIPAAPYHQEGHSLSVTVSFLTKEQLRAIDSTEPTYRRVRLSSGNYPVTLGNGEVLDSTYVYVSRFGVLDSGAGCPIPLSSQVELFKTLNDAKIGKGFFGGLGKSVCDKIAGKGIWAHNRIRASDVFDGIILADNIVGLEETSLYEWFEDYEPVVSTTPRVSLSQTELGFDINDLTDEEYNMFMEGMSEDELLDEAWLNADFEEEYTNWWNDIESYETPSSLY